MRTLLGILVAALVVIVACLSFYTVDASKYGYVTVLGRHVATYDGGSDGAGLHFGWPWPIRSLQRLDRRIQQFDLPASEHLTSDRENKTVDKNLSVQGYVVWRIDGADAVDTFVRRIGTPDRAKTILRDRIAGEIRASLSSMTMDDLINVNAGQVDAAMAKWHSALLAKLRTSLAEEYGIQLVDIRLRRFNYPGETRTAIFNRIRSERQKKVAEYQTEGQLLASKIKSEAEEKYRTILAEAKLEEERLKGKADAEAMLIRNQAHSQDPEFYAFLKQMEKLTNILSDNRTVLLMSAQRPLFDLLFQPPRPGTTPATPVAPASPMPTPPVVNTPSTRGPAPTVSNNEARPPLPTGKSEVGTAGPAKKEGN